MSNEAKFNSSCWWSTRVSSVKKLTSGHKYVNVKRSMYESMLVWEEVNRNEERRGPPGSIYAETYHLRKKYSQNVVAEILLSYHQYDDLNKGFLRLEKSVCQEQAFNQQWTPETYLAALKHSAENHCTTCQKSLLWTSILSSSFFVSIGNRKHYKYCANGTSTCNFTKPGGYNTHVNKK